jgi:hypothetical protein
MRLENVYIDGGRRAAILLFIVLKTGSVVDSARILGH